MSASLRGVACAALLVAAPWAAGGQGEAEGRAPAAGGETPAERRAEPTERPEKAGSPAQYEITIVQGAGRAEAEALMSDRYAYTQSTRSSRGGAETTTLRVVSGKPASIQTGRILNAVDAVFLSRYGDGIGVQRTEKPLTRGFSVTATQRGNLVEVEIEVAMAREGQDDPANRQVQAAKTSLVVPVGEWNVVGGGARREDRAAKTYATRSRLEDSVVLLRVDPVPVPARKPAPRGGASP